MIGGFAAETQGVGWRTLDVDIVIAAEETTYVAVAAALVELDAWCLVPKGSTQRIRPDVGMLRVMNGTLLLRTRHGRLDIMKSADSGSTGERYETLAAEAVETLADGRPYLVASLTSILRMKRAANRPKDQKVLSLIEAAILEKDEGAH